MTRKETMGQAIKCDNLHHPTADRIAAASANLN